MKKCILDEKIEVLVLIVKLSDGTVRQLSTNKETDLEVLLFIQKRQGIVKVCKENLDGINLAYPDGKTLQNFL